MSLSNARSRVSLSAARTAAVPTRMIQYDERPKTQVLTNGVVRTIERIEEQVETIRSSDGTPIAYQRSGQGAPLVLVHGTTADHTRWAPVLPMFEQFFTVYAVDRRGRGGSGDAQVYAVEREVEDIVAVVNSIAEPVFLLGHSFGAILCLEAACRTLHMRKLVLYEPPIPIPPGSKLYPSEIISRIQAFLDRRDQEGALTTFYREVVQTPAHELERLRAAPNWSARVAAAYTIPRELGWVNEYVFEPTRFGDLRTPSLLLLGGESPAFQKRAVEAVHAALPASQLRILAGQQHIAINTAPELFTREVVEYLN
jgi:pimeloyl-ACP methyl ester carboxylesterase